MKNLIPLQYSLLIFISLLLLTCCTNNNKENKMADEIIDFNSYKIKEVAGIPDEIIQSKTYIKLDASSDKFLFKKIDKIKITGQRIYILDERMKKLIVFDSNGKGIGLVGRQGQGPGEFIRISDFDVDNEGNIYLLDPTANTDRLFKFDPDFNHIWTKKLPFETDIIKCIGGKFIFGVASWEPGTNIRIAICDTAFNIHKADLEYDEYKDDNFWISGYNFIESDNTIYYNKPIDNFIYTFDMDGNLKNSVYIDFGKQNVPLEERKDIEKNWKKFERYSCLVNFTAITEKYIVGGLFERLQDKFFIIDRTNNIVYKGSETEGSKNSNLTGFYNNTIISYIYPGKYEDIERQDFPNDIKDYINDENFVVCIYKLMN